MTELLRKPQGLETRLQSAAAGIRFAEHDDDAAERRPAAIAGNPADDPASATPIRRRGGSTWHCWAASMGFHLLVLGAAVQIAAWMGWGIPEEWNVLTAIQAAFGEEEIEGDEAFSEDVEAPTFELPAALQQRQEQRVPGDFVTEADTTNAFAASQFAPALTDEGTDEDSSDAAEGRGFRFSKPAGGQAVTKGSFTIWTEPADPLPLRPYSIVVQIKLPPEVDRFPKSDLRIEVEGTDGFYLKMPDARRGISLIGDLPIVKNEVQLVIPIPEAAPEVRDRITIESHKILEERQQLEIEF